MRRIVVSFSIVVIALVGVSVWQLRQPLRSAVSYVRESIRPVPTVRFAVVGDNHGVNPIYRQIIADLKDQPYAFLLNLADTSEHGTREEFLAVKELEATLPFPVYHTVGSHDIKADPSRQTFIDVFSHTPWYAIDQGQVHLIILDNADRKVGFPAASLTWLENDLAAHRDQVDIIAYHRPFGLPLASLLGDDETSASRLTNDAFLAIIKRQPVAQIFSAHLHAYIPYTLGGMPAVVSGGGGDPAQSVLGGANHNDFHYLDVVVRGSAVTVTPVRVTLRS